MTNYLQTHLQHSGNHLFLILFNSFFEPQTLFSGSTPLRPGKRLGLRSVTPPKSVWGSKKAVKNDRKKEVSWMLKMGLQIICHLRIWRQINKFNDWCKSEKAWISTIMSRITFAWHGTALFYSCWFKKNKFVVKAWLLNFLIHCK